LPENQHRQERQRCQLKKKSNIILKGTA